MPNLLKLFPKFEEQKTFITYFVKPTLKALEENYRPIFLMNIDAQILNKILAN